MHELFEAQAAQRPEAVAVVYEGECLKLRGVECASQPVGRYLRELGVGPEVRVGMCVERSVEMVVGILGVLKAGGAYVPLDPGYPVERLAFLMEDTRTPVLLTQQHLRQQLPVGWAQCCVWTREAGIRLVAGMGAIWNHAARAENLAYVIYTSGSTGQAKGVEVEHADQQL